MLRLKGSASLIGSCKMQNCKMQKCKCARSAKLQMHSFERSKYISTLDAAKVEKRLLDWFLHNCTIAQSHNYRCIIADCTIANQVQEEQAQIKIGCCKSEIMCFQPLDTGAGRDNGAWHSPGAGSPSSTWSHSSF